MKYVPTISSDFAILDVKRGRSALADAFFKNPGVRFKLVIEAEIDALWSEDDGTSREFALEVKAMRWEAEQ